MGLIIILYIVTGLIVLRNEYRRVIKERCISLGTFSFVFFSILCLIIPGLTIWKGDVSRCKDNSLFYVFLSYVVTFVSLIFAYWGYNRGRKTKNNIVKATKITKNRNLLLTSFVLLVISLIALYYWSSGYGGIFNVMLVGGHIRASFIQSTNSLMFLKHLIPMSIISSLLMYTDLFIIRSKRYRFFKFLIFILSVIVSFIYIIANDGRMLAGTYLLYFILIYLKYQYEVLHVSIKKIIVSSVIIVSLIFFIIIQSESWFATYRNAEVEVLNRSVLDIILGEFNFIYVGLNTALYSVLEDHAYYTLFNDIINGLFAWLPTSIKPIVLADVWDYNSILINDGGYGQSPTNLPTQAYYDLGIVGVMFVSYIFLYFIGSIEKRLRGNYTTIGLVFYVVIGFYLCRGVAYFSMYNIMINMFFIAISWLLYKHLFSKI